MALGATSATCRSVSTVSDKRLRHGVSGYETKSHKLDFAVHCPIYVFECSINTCMYTHS